MNTSRLRLRDYLFSKGLGFIWVITGYVFSALCFIAVMSAITLGHLTPISIILPIFAVLFCAVIWGFTWWGIHERSMKSQKNEEHVGLKTVGNVTMMDEGTSLWRGDSMKMLELMQYAIKHDDDLYEHTYGIIDPRGHILHGRSSDVQHHFRTVEGIQVREDVTVLSEKETKSARAIFSALNERSAESLPPMLRVLREGSPWAKQKAMENAF